MGDKYIKKIIELGNLDKIDVSLRVLNGIRANPDNGLSESDRAIVKDVEQIMRKLYHSPIYTGDD